LGPYAAIYGNTRYNYLRAGYMLSVSGNYQQAIKGQIGLRYTW
jgi:hypothetical protein